MKIILITAVAILGISNVKSTVPKGWDNNSPALASNNDEKKNEYEFGLLLGNNISKNGKKMAKDLFYLQPGFNYSNINGYYAVLLSTYIPSDKKSL